MAEPGSSGGRAWRLALGAGVAAVLIGVGLLVLEPWRLAEIPSSTPSVVPSGTAIPSEPTRTPVPPIPTPSHTPSRAPTPKEDPAAPVELTPVDPGDSVQGEDGMRVALTKIESVQGEAVQPGEVAGPAIRVTVTVTNGTQATFNTAAIVVNAFYGEDRTPAGQLAQPGGAPFLGRLAPGETTYGTYLFAIPTKERSNVTITVDYSTEVGIVVFKGDLS